MLKGKILGICLLMLMFLFCLNFNGLIKARECGEDIIGITTSPGNLIIPPLWRCDCSPYIPLEFDDNSTPDTIAPDSNINVYISEGCAPYTYTVSGTGYTWHANGSTTLVSNDLNEQLDCASGT